jgi:hypothetical protein
MRATASYQGLEGESDSGGVDDRTVAADRSAALELTEPAVARRDTEPHPGGEFRDGQPAILLQECKDFAVSPVHAADSSTMTP